MSTYSWLTSFVVAARSAEVKEQKNDDDGAVDVDVGFAQTKDGTFNSPGQLSVVSTVAPSDLSDPDLELGQDWDDWCSDCSGPDAESLEETFPCLSAFDQRREAKKSMKAWSAIGHRMASSLASCEDDTDNESVPSTITSIATQAIANSPWRQKQAKVSMEAWAEVGQRFASALANCEVDDDEECYSIRRTPQEEMHNKIDGWTSVGDRLATVFAKAAQEEELLDAEYCLAGPYS
jgi:hypothetical protein